MRARPALLLAAVLVTASACKPKPAEVRVVPPKVTIYGLGRPVTLSAEVLDRKGKPVPEAKVAWTSLKPKVASVDANGVVRAVSGGRTAVTATLGLLAATSSVEVVDVSTIAVSPARATIAGPAGSKTTFRAEAKTTKGVVVPGLVPKWTTSDPKIALVDANGVVTSLSQGRATITASLGEIGGVADVKAVFREVATFEVSPPTLLLKVGDVQSINVIAKDAAGTAIDDLAVDWASSDPKTALANNGLVTGIARGTATIRVVSGTRSAEVAVLVN